MNGKALAGSLIAIAFATLFTAALIPAALSWPATAPGSGGVGAALWEGRTFEVLLQGIVLLGGVVAILLLLGTRKTKEASP
jgi:hypothetical protein